MQLTLARRLLERLAGQIATSEERHGELTQELPEARDLMGDGREAEFVRNAPALAHRPKCSAPRSLAGWETFGSNWAAWMETWRSQLSVSPTPRPAGFAPPTNGVRWKPAASRPQRDHDAADAERQTAQTRAGAYRADLAAEPRPSKRSGCNWAISVKQSASWRRISSVARRS